MPRPPSSPPAPLGFPAGVAIGVILSAIAAQAWLAVHLAPVAATWANFQAEAISSLARLAASPAWRWGVPLATAVVLTALLALGARRARWYAVVAAVAVAAAAATYVWAMAPWTELAGQIR